MIQAMIQSTSSNEVAILIDGGKDMRFRGLSQQEVNVMKQDLKVSFSETCQDKVLKLYAVAD